MTTLERFPRSVSYEQPNISAELTRYSVESLLMHQENGDFPPFGLVEFGMSEKDVRVVTEFNPNDPFGHLGKSIADTMANSLLPLYDTDQIEKEELDRVIGNMFPGSVFMGYALAMIAKVAYRDGALPADSEGRSRVLSAIARRSFGALVFQLAHRNGESAQRIMDQHTVRARNGETPFVRDEFSKIFPNKRNPFRDRPYRLDKTSAGRYIVTNRFFLPPSLGSILGVCRASETRLDNGVIALKAAWSHGVGIATENHYQDPAAMEWALR